MRTLFMGAAAGLVILSVPAQEIISSPQGAVAAVGRVVKNRSLKGLRTVLTDDARERFAHRQGLQALSEALSGLDIEGGRAQLIDTRTDYDQRTIYRQYSVEVIAKSADPAEPTRSLGTATVECDIDYVRTYCASENLDHSCSQWAFQQVEEEQSYCKISKLDLN
jgi:hypothetical protein